MTDTCSSFRQAFVPLGVQISGSFVGAAHKVTHIIIIVDGMNPYNPLLSRSTINDFLEIPKTLPLNINYRTTHYPTESKNSSSVTSWILTTANSRLMGNRGA